MLNLFLIMSYLGSLSSNQMLSMLLLLVASYIAASLWFIQQGAIYTGLLYILVYVGAIVVLVMFVVQLTNTSLNGDNGDNLNNYNQYQNFILILMIYLLLIINSEYLINDLLILNYTDINLNDNLLITSVNKLENVLMIQKGLNYDNLSILANSIFNEYAIILIISVYAIILAVLGPIKIALNKD